MFINRYFSDLNDKSKKNDKLFKQNLQKLPLSLICHLIWYLYKKREHTQHIFTLNPFSFIFRYENKYFLNGSNCLDLYDGVKWFNTNMILFFIETSLWNRIYEIFYNFRNVETNKKIPSYITYDTFSLNINSFKPENVLNNYITELPSVEYSLPKKYRHLKEGLTFGYIKNKNIVSLASAQILNNKEYSFAILRGIKTINIERRQNYGLKTVSKLCEELFSRFRVKNIFLWVNSDNKAAINLYQKLGFSKEIELYLTYCDLILK